MMKSVLTLGRRSLIRGRPGRSSINASIKRLKEEMAEISEEQKRIREAQRNMRAKFEEIPAEQECRRRVQGNVRATTELTESCRHVKTAETITSRTAETPPRFKFNFIVDSSRVNFLFEMPRAVKGENGCNNLAKATNPFTYMSGLITGIWKKPKE